MRHLRPYQERGEQDIFKEWERHDILFFQLATGGGKTVIFTDVIMKFLLKGLRVMLIAHREELITQAWQTLYDAKILAGIIQGSTPTNYALPAQVCSIQTICRRQHLPPADLIVIDEGHHVTDDNSYGKILQRYPHAKVLIVSATPYRLSGEGFLNIVPGKETRLITNSTLHNLIDDGWLTPLRLFASYVPDTDDIDLSRGEFNDAQAYEKMKLAPIVQSWLDNAKDKQGLCFAQNVAHSIQVARQYWQQGIPAEHLDADSTTEKRQQVLSDYNAGLVKVVCNVGLFTEGTDFPNCEFIQLGRLTKSLSMYLQMVGRGTRPLRGLVDQYLTGEERRRAIAHSTKPDCLVLDCAGLFKEHFLPDFPHDWERYFRGTRSEKKQKKEDPEDSLEMLVYVAEDKDGNRVRRHSAKEVEGMQLIEITKEVRRKMVNLKAVKEFDRILAYQLSQYTAKTPAHRAVDLYMKYCAKFSILMVPELWDYMKRKLIDEPKQRAAEMHQRQIANPTAYPAHVINQALQNIARGSVPEMWLIEQKAKYYRQNSAQMVMHSQHKAAEADPSKSYLKI